MLFRAQNLGPVREAELDLSKSLIILAGPNNSGKTYLGWALYGLSQFNRPMPCVGALVQAAIASPTGSHQAGPVQEFMAEFAEQLCAHYAKHVHRDFSASAHAFASTLLTLVPDATSVSRMGTTFRTGEHRLQCVLEEQKGSIYIRVSAYKRPSNGEGLNRIELNAKSVSLSSFSAEALEEFASGTTRSLTGKLNHMLFGSTFTIFPVERIATTIFARELLLRRVEMLDEDLDESGESTSALPVRAGRYPLPIHHSLLGATDLSALSREEGQFHDLADELEISVLQGRFTVSEHGDMLFIPRATPQQPLGLHQSASVIKSLSAIVFYLRYTAQSGDHIIIDEPELNLHPDNQRRVARVLAKAVNRGLKIMMSTHSDYLIGEFNNLLMLGRDTPQAAAVREELGYDAASTLKPEQVGVYLVSDGLCKSIDVKQTGFEIKTFEDAFHSMNRDAQTIYSRIFAESE